MESVVSHFRKYSMSMHLVTTSVTLVQGQKMDAEKNDIPGLDQRGQRQLDCRSEAPNFSPAWFFSGNSQLRKLSTSRSMSLTFWLWSGNVLEVYIKNYGRLMNVVGCWYRKMQFMALCSILEHCVDGIYADFLLHNGTSFKPCLMVHQSKIFWYLKVAVVVSCRTLFALWKDAIPMPYSLRKTLNKVISNHS